MKVSLARSRWAAIGAAVAVTLGAGGLHFADAATPANPVTTLITPCRLMDTRPNFNVGPRSTPLGATETYPVTVRGTNGNCTIPATATGIIANVTIVNPTASSYLTIWPADAPQPNASSLNWVPAQPATPNQVTTGLSADGKIKLYNLSGTVHVIIDITGYLTPADLSNYYTKGEVDTANAAQNATVSSLAATVSSLKANTYTKGQVDVAVADAAKCKGFPHSGVLWHGCVLASANLNNANLTSADLTAANFGNASLKSAQLSSSNATSANFDEADLTGAIFVFANLSGATLTNSKLSGADLKFTNLTGAHLAGADLTGTIWASTTCPDGTNSVNDGNTCVGHL